jgi:hypothetical protein
MKILQTVYSLILPLSKSMAFTTSIFTKLSFAEQNLFFLKNEFHENPTSCLFADTRSQTDVYEHTDMVYTYGARFCFLKNT